jgi:hypothetical protein
MVFLTIPLGGFMRRLFMLLVLAASLTGCAISADGQAEPAQPVAVQGAGDAQGAPIYSNPTPGTQIGIGVGRGGGRSGAGIGIGVGF